jgi:hypothetical protein
VLPTRTKGQGSLVRVGNTIGTNIDPLVRVGLTNSTNGSLQLRKLGPGTNGPRLTEANVLNRSLFSTSVRHTTTLVMMRHTCHYRKGGILLVFLSSNKILLLVIAHGNLIRRNLVGKVHTRF